MGKFADRLRKYFKEPPKDVQERDWEEIAPLNEVGLDVMEWAEGMREYRRAMNAQEKRKA